MSGPVHDMQQARLTRLRDLRLKRATADLKLAATAEVAADSRLKLVRATLQGRRSMRARAHRRLYKAMLDNGVNARGLEALDAAFETHDMDIARAEEAVGRAEQRLETARAERAAAAAQVQLRQKDCAVWAEALRHPARVRRKADARSHDRAQDAIAEHAVLRPLR